MNLDYAIAESEEDRSAAFRLRYSILVEELGLEIPEADHARHIVRDDFDSIALICVAKHCGEVVATKAINLLRDGPFRHQEKFRLAELHPDVPEREIVHISNMFVAKAHRATSIFMGISLFGFRLCVESGCTLAVLFCTPPTDGIYRKLGFRYYPDHTFDLPGHGRVIPMYYQSGRGARPTRLELLG